MGLVDIYPANKPTLRIYLIFSGTSETFIPVVLTTTGKNYEFCALAAAHYERDPRRAAAPYENEPRRAATQYEDELCGDTGYYEGAPHRDSGQHQSEPRGVYTVDSINYQKCLK